MGTTRRTLGLNADQRSPCSARSHAARKSFGSAFAGQAAAGACTRTAAIRWRISLAARKAVVNDDTTSRGSHSHDHGLTKSDDRDVAVSQSRRADAQGQQPLHSRHQQTNVERSQRVDCAIHRLTQQTFGQL